MRFEKLPAVEGVMTIISQVAGKLTEYFYRIFEKRFTKLPTRVERPQTTTLVKIALPVDAKYNGVPRLTTNGESVFAYLPITLIPQLKFLIHADFVLAGSRQAIIDNVWNRTLRNSVVFLFANAVEEIIRENSRLSYEWLAYLPQQPVNGFWKPLRDHIDSYLTAKALVYSRAGSLHAPNRIRIPLKYYVHGDAPLLPDTNPAWQFLSDRYRAQHFNTLISLGVSYTSIDEALELVDRDILGESSRLRDTDLDDAWHSSFLAFIQRILDLKNPVLKTKIFRQCIIPVRVRKELQWWQPGQSIYFPTVVEEGTGSDMIRIEMPLGIKLVVLHPDAATETSRKQVYYSLGVRSCPPSVLCDAIEKLQTKSGTKVDKDLVSSLELLFWFSHKMSVWGKEALIASTATAQYGKTRTLFMRSDEPYHAECLLRLAENPQYLNRFLDKRYQASPVSTRSRGGHTWEQWLCEIAGIQWFPPLQAPEDRDRLHWMIEAIRDENPAIFIPFVQHYWSHSYRFTCLLSAKLKQSLMECKVLCQHGGFEELQKTWLPTRVIVETSQIYGIEKKVPILSLPESDEEPSMSQWPSLSDLGVHAALDLYFYRQALVLLSIGGKAPGTTLETMSSLYRDMGKRATLEDKTSLQAEFQENPLVWDSVSNKWRILSECVWECSIELKSKFVLTATYEESDVQGLFLQLLNTSEVTSTHLTDELHYIAAHLVSDQHETILNRVTAIYALLRDLAGAPVEKMWLQSIFKHQPLIYIGSSNSHDWIRSTSCIWHTIDMEAFKPIGALYPALKDFFVDILGVRPVNSAFMMERLAATAKKTNKTAVEIKNLMISTSQLLDSGSQSHQFDKSIKQLEESRYLPCKLSSGEIAFCLATETFFIVDNQIYAEKFDKMLIMLDFTYEQLISLHELFRILGLDDHYLTRHVRSEPSVETWTLDEGLTDQFRQCAYSISCCAISHRSPSYSGQNRQMYDALVAASMLTSSDMSTKLVVVQDKIEIKVESAKSYLIMKRDQEGISITLPKAMAERALCMRSELPGALAEILQIFDSTGEKQIYRIINELDSGTDEILLSENISRVIWLPETHRPKPPPKPDEANETEYETTGETEPNVLVRQTSNFYSGSLQNASADSQTNLDIDRVESISRSAASIPVNNLRTFPPPFRALPAAPNHESDAPLYWKVLGHAAKQGALLGSRSQGVADPSSDDIAHMFESLTLQTTSFDPADDASLFGADFWLSKFRVGAAGELLVYEFLKQLSLNDFGLDNWQSKIRYLVQAHERYHYVTRWHQPETADITYTDQAHLLGTLFRSEIFDDMFEVDVPDWLEDLQEDGDDDLRKEEIEDLQNEDDGGRPEEDDESPLEEADIDLQQEEDDDDDDDDLQEDDERQPLEWLFEVKTTVGPCETDFYMSPSQYELMRTIGEEDDEQRKRVYCIVRVFNLLSNEVGIRFFIDPWRLREGLLEFGTTDKWKVTPISTSE